MQTPIVIFAGQVLDGWHQYSLTRELGLPCPMLQFDSSGPLSPADFVRVNEAHRQIDQSQRALSESKVQAWERKHAPAGAVALELREQAERAGVSKATMNRANRVLSTGNEAVIAAVDRDEIGLEKALAVAVLPPEQQATALRTELPRRKRDANWGSHAPTVGAPAGYCCYGCYSAGA